mgnify:CR=1 FL=1
MGLPSEGGPSSFTLYHIFSALSIRKAVLFTFFLHYYHFKRHHVIISLDITNSYCNFVQISENKLFIKKVLTFC